MEWLPWVGRHQMGPPKNKEDWAQTLRARFQRQNREVGIDSPHAHEVFTISAWGEVPSLEQIVSDFPSFARQYSHLDGGTAPQSLARPVTDERSLNPQTRRRPP